MNIRVGQDLKTTSEFEKSYPSHLSLRCETTPIYLINNEFELIPHHSPHNFRRPLAMGLNYTPVYLSYSKGR